MSSMEWVVSSGAVAAIAWVNWYFFVAGRARVSAEAAFNADGSADRGGDGTGPMAEVVIEVDGGYSPNTVRVRAGRPVRLVFDRRDDSSCSEEVVLPDFGIRRYLPTGQRTAIEITPAKAGRYEFMCGMSMLRGTILAQE
jgi:plastocyanin domain-containing protein